MPWFWLEKDSINESEIAELAERTLEEARQRVVGHDCRRVLLLPPDLTRAHCGAGRITEILYNALSPQCDVQVIPTLGQHIPHTAEENRSMFGTIPHERIHAHDWLNGVTRVGTIPASMVRDTTAGAADWDISVDLNTSLMLEPWDLIINIGHVVPHEVLGFANHNKNYFIGLGGKETICTSHMAAAMYGIENNLGQLITPLRHCYNWAEEQMLSHLPDLYFQIVMTRAEDGSLKTSGIYVGDDLETYLLAAKASQAKNITKFATPPMKIVAVMQADEFRSTWVANKAVYRTRMALADGGELLVIAPGLSRFGEQPEVETLIRKYGYRGRDETLRQYRLNADLRDMAHGAAHLIHSSSEGRFTIRYAPGQLTRREIESVNYEYEDLEEAQRRYPADKMKEGWNSMPDGEEVFYISTPSTGLWSTRDRLERKVS